MKLCRYCHRLVDYADHLGTCAAVRFALDAKFTPGPGWRGGTVSPAKLAGLCARPGCDQPRTHGPYCHNHRLAVARTSQARRKAQQRVSA